MSRHCARTCVLHFHLRTSPPSRAAGFSFSHSVRKLRKLRSPQSAAPHPSSATSPLIAAQAVATLKQAASPRPHGCWLKPCRVVHCQISLIEVNASSPLPYVFSLIAAMRPRLGGEAMATTADYRKWAEECFEWARQASDESVREQYASLGRVWLDCAARAELWSGAITSSEPKVA